MSKPFASIAVVAAFVICACGGAANAAKSTASPSPGGRGNAFRGGASGQLVQINPQTLILTGPNGDITVTYSDSTTIAKTVNVTAADMTTGVCVAATGPKDASSGGLATATNVRITPAASSGCTNGGFGAGPTTSPRPDATPRPGATPRTPGGFATMAFVFGAVTSVNGGSVTVTSSDSTSSTFTLSPSATFIKTTVVTSAALQTGECVNAAGPSDSSGNVNATSLNITPPNASGTCQARFGGGFGGGGRRGGGGGGGNPPDGGGTTTGGIGG